MSAGMPFGEVVSIEGARYWAHSMPSGTYNRVFKIQGFSTRNGRMTVVLKIPHPFSSINRDSAAMCESSRAVRLVQELPTPVFAQAIRVRWRGEELNGWVTEYFADSHSAKPMESLYGMIEVFQANGRIVFDPYCEGNFRTRGEGREREIRLVDVDLALRRGSVASENFLKDSTGQISYQGIEYLLKPLYLTVPQRAVFRVHLEVMKFLTAATIVLSEQSGSPEFLGPEAAVEGALKIVFLKGTMLGESPLAFEDFPLFQRLLPSERLREVVHDAVREIFSHNLSFELKLKLIFRLSMGFDVPLTKEEFDLRCEDYLLRRAFQKISAEHFHATGGCENQAQRALEVSLGLRPADLLRLMPAAVRAYREALKGLFPDFLERNEAALKSLIQSHLLIISWESLTEDPARRALLDKLVSALKRFDGERDSVSRLLQIFYQFEGVLGAAGPLDDSVNKESVRTLANIRECLEAAFPGSVKSDEEVRRVREKTKALVFQAWVNRECERRRSRMTELPVSFS